MCAHSSSVQAPVSHAKLHNGKVTIEHLRSIQEKLVDRTVLVALESKVCAQ